MAANQVELPAGFVLDAPAASGTADLPDGFVLDNASQASPAITPQGRFRQTASRIALGLLRGGPLGAATAGVSEAMQGMDEVGEAAGGAVTDKLAGVVPPEVAAVAGTIVKVGIPSVIGGGVGAGAGRPMMDAAAQRIMQSALKPTSKSLANHDASKAIDTMLREGLDVTPGGAAKLRVMIGRLKGEVGKLIAGSKANVNKGYVFSELSKTLDDVTKRGLPDADRAAVLQAWKEFKNHPLLKDLDQIPVQLADDVKRATQQSLKDFYRRNPNSSAPLGAEKAEAALASGLRQGLEDAVPGVGQYNAKLSEYLNALHQIEPRAAIAANRDLGGLVPLADTPEMAMLMLADRNPWLKSLVARVLHQGRTAIPAGGGAVAGATVPAGEQR